MLKKAEARLARLQSESDDPDMWIDTMIEVEELKDRLRCAWDDDEYDETYAMENYPEDFQ